MSEAPESRSFERWALVGACTLALVGIAAFWARRVPPGSTVVEEEERTGADLVRIRIGGERPPRPEPDHESQDSGRRTQLDTGPGPDDGEQTRPGGDKSPHGDSQAAPPPPPASPRTITVRAGETLGEIAQRELGTVRRLGEIVELNGLQDPDNVPAGTTLLIPPR